MKKLITRQEIECIRRTGRDEEGRRTTIGLAELDALCADADYLLDVADLALGLGELVMRHWSTRSPMRGLPADWAAQVATLRKKLRREGSDG